MPHQPIDDVYEERRASLAVISPVWSPTSLNYIHGSDLASLVMVQEAASTNNPVRKDGTRAPSAHWARRVIVKSSPVTAATTSEYGWFMHDLSRPAPRLTNWGTDMAQWQTAVRSPAAEINVDARARTAFLNKLADRSGKDLVPLGTMAGEFVETIDLATGLASHLVSSTRQLAAAVEKPAGLVGRVLYAYKDGGGRAAALQLLNGDVRLLESIISGWLVTQFGIRPLMHDSYAATAYLAASMAENDGLLISAHVKGGASDEVNRDVLLQGDGQSGAQYQLFGRFRLTVAAHYACTYKVPTRATVWQELGLYNSAAVAWELCRYSWMADYLLEFGPWARSLMAAQDCSFVEGSVSYTTKASLVKLWTTVRPNDTVTVDPAKGAMVIQVDRFDRELVSNGVMPSFLPGINNRLGLSELTNSIAALTTLVGSRVPYGPRIY